MRHFFSQHHQAPQLDCKVVVIDRKASSNCSSLFLACSILTLLRLSILFPTSCYPLAFTDKLPSRPHNVMCFAEDSIATYIIQHMHLAKHSLPSVTLMMFCGSRLDRLGVCRDPQALSPYEAAVAQYEAAAAAKLRNHKARRARRRVVVKEKVLRRRAARKQRRQERVAADPRKQACVEPGQKSKVATRDGVIERKQAVSLLTQMHHNV